jgi:phage terminase large subunit
LRYASRRRKKEAEVKAVRLSKGDLQPKLYERVDGLGIEALEVLEAVLAKAVAQNIDPDAISEDDLLGLIDQIDAPRLPTVVDIIQGMDNEDLEQLVEAAPTPTDRYLAQAELLTRQGQLYEPKTTNSWPIDYDKVRAWRERELVLYEQDPSYFAQRKAFYGSGVEGCIAFINHWIDTHDPRNAGMRGPDGRKMASTLPLILFQRQEDLVRFMFACMEAEADGLVEKTRDMGATWVALAVAIWAWLFWDAVTFGFGSATAVKLDRSGDAGSIFYKLREVARGLPKCFRPKGLKPKEHLLDKRVFNPDNGSGIVGEVGDEVGRGSRTRVYVVDEAAHFEHPEAVTAALSDTTRVRIDISSVSGLGTVFHRMRQGGLVWEPGQQVDPQRTNVLIMDWRHHPAKTQQWYNARQAKFEADGLAHIFAQEVDRDYAAALQGTIVPKKWLDACVDAHLKIPGDWESGAWIAGQDVADGGHDTNAFVARKGWVVKVAQQWGERDTALTTRRMLQYANECRGDDPMLISYDSVGVGSGVKAEANRLKDDGLFPDGIRLEPWNGGSSVQYPGRNVIEGDKKSPRNKDHYANLKAQGWGSLRTRVYRTYRAVTEGELSPIDDMISFDSKAIGAKLYKLIEEIAQPQQKINTRMKFEVDKVPDGASSPNLGDACMECCFPLMKNQLSNVASAFAPRAVGQARNSCQSCGSGEVVTLAQANTYHCHACGYKGDWSRVATDDVRDRVAHSNFPSARAWGR